MEMSCDLLKKERILKSILNPEDVISAEIWFLIFSLFKENHNIKERKLKMIKTRKLNLKLVGYPWACGVQLLL